MPNTDGPLDAKNAAGNSEARKPTTVPAPSAASPELSPRPQRRTFSATAKLRILAETDRAADTGGVPPLPAREGLFPATPPRWAPPARWGRLRGAKAATTRSPA